MKSIDEIVESYEDIQINEAQLDAKKLVFTPVKLKKSSIGQDTAICVGNIFTTKQEKYATQLEASLTQNLGLTIKVGIAKAKSMIKQPTTKLIYLIYAQNNVMICNSDICKPLDGSKLQ